MIICFLVMLIKFHSVNLQKCMFQPCLFWNTLGCRRVLFQCLRMQDSSTLPEWLEWSGPRTEQAAPNPSFISQLWLRNTLGEPHVTTAMNPKGQRALQSKGPQVGLTLAEAAEGEGDLYTAPQKSTHKRWAGTCGPTSKATESYPKSVCQHHSGRVPYFGCQPPIF